VSARADSSPVDGGATRGTARLSKQAWATSRARSGHTGRVWTNCYHAYPAHAAFGGCKQSGIGRETRKMMLDHYQQTENLLVSYSESPLGFF